MVTEVLIWCDHGPEIGMGHYARSFSLFQNLKNDCRLEVKFMASKIPNPQYRPDVIIFDSTNINHELFNFIKKVKTRILISPVCSDYSCFDYYVGRILPFDKTAKLKKYIGEICFDSELANLRSARAQKQDQVSVCLSGGNYQQNLIPAITKSLVLSGKFKKIHFPWHYMELALPQTQDVAYIFHKSNDIWLSEFGESKYFIGSDGLMIFEALLLQKSILSITTKERLRKVVHYEKEGLLSISICDGGIISDLSKNIQNYMAQNLSNQDIKNKLWYMNNVIDGGKIINNIIFNNTFNS